MARNLLIANEQLGSRAVIDPVSLPDLEVRGWVGVGLCSEPSRVPLLTDAEAAAVAAAEAERIAALLKSDVAPAASRPSK
jgi:hypothetical protein